MNRQELEALVAQGESETLEFKRSTSELEAGMRTATALLNTGRGGVVLFGVSDSGRMIGFEVSDRTIQNLANGIRQIQPASGIQIHQIPVDGDKAVIALDVPVSELVHTYKRIPYQRVGNTTDQMPHDIFERRLVKRAHRSERWETFPAVG